MGSDGDGQALNLYDEYDWGTLKTFMRDVAKGRDLYDCASEIKMAIAKKIISSPVFFIRHFLKTVDKEGDVVQQEPWLGQVFLDVCCESQRRRGYAQKVIEIKPRQVGWTQHNIARAFWACMRPNTNALLLVNDEDVSEKAMHRVGTFYNGLEDWLRPLKRIDNPKSLVFDNPRAESRADNPGLNSTFTCTVPSGIRGITPHYFIWSEAAFPPKGCDPNDIVEAVFNAMGASSRFCTILDSTPNGKDDFYYPMVMQAVERNPKWVASWSRKGAPTRQQIIDGILGEPDRPKDGFVPAFFPWHWHEEYTSQDESLTGHLPCLDDEQIKHLKQTLGKLEEFGGDEEIELSERYGVSIYRLAWRRYKILNDSGTGDDYDRILTFRQEHASDYKSCFINIGRSTWDPRGMDVIARDLCPPAVHGRIRKREKDGAFYVDQTFVSNWENLRVWATPQREEDYVIGVDGAENWESSNGDSWVAQVLRRRDRKQVAVLEMRLPPGEIKDRLYMLCAYYNWPLLGIEMEGSAIDVARSLFMRGVTRQYRWKRMDSDPYKEGSTDYLGWETSSKSRPHMQNLLVEAVGAKDKEGHPRPSIILRDEKTYSEMASCTRDSYGKIAAEGKTHDDHVLALMIALAINEDVWESQRRPPKPVDTRQDNPLLERYKYAQGAVRNRPTYDTM